MRTLADLFVGKNNNLTFIRLMAALSVIYGHTPAIVAEYRQTGSQRQPATPSLVALRSTCSS